MHNNTTINIQITNVKIVIVNNHNQTAVGMAMVNVVIKEIEVVTITRIGMINVLKTGTGAITITGVVMINVLKAGIGVVSIQTKTDADKEKMGVMVNGLHNIADKILMQTTDRINFNIISSIIYNRKGCCKAAFLLDRDLTDFQDYWDLIEYSSEKSVKSA